MLSLSALTGSFVYSRDVPLRSSWGGAVASSCVILSASEEFPRPSREILRFTQDDKYCHRCLTWAWDGCTIAICLDRPKSGAPFQYYALP